MSTRTTVVLAVLLLLALLAFVFATPAPPPVTRVPPRFIEFAAEDVDALEIEHGAASVRLRKTDGAWWIMVEGHWVPAARVPVEGMLHEIERLEPAGFYPAETVKGEDTAKWELDRTPSARVVLDAGAEQFVAEFHGLTLEGANVYARRDGGEDVYVVPVEGMQAVHRMTVERLRRRTAVDFPTHEIASVAVAREGRPLLRIRKADALFYDVEQPFKGRADPIAVENLLSRIVNLEALEFVADGAPDFDRFGLLPQDAWATIEIRREGQEEPIRILLGHESGGGGRYFRIDDLPSVMSSAMNLPRGIAALDPVRFRDHHVLRLGNETIERIEFEQGETKWTLAKVGDRWDIARPDRLVAETADVESLLEALRSLQAVTFLDAEDPKAHALEDADGAHAVLRLHGVEAVGNRTLAWSFPDDAGNVRARVVGGAGFPDGGPVVLLDGRLLQQLERGWLRYRDRSVWPAQQLGHIRGLERRIGDRREAFVRRADGSWANADERGPAPNREALIAAMTNIQAVEAIAWVERADDASKRRRYGVGDPPATGAVTLVIRSDDETNERRLTLLFGTATGDGKAHHARRVGSDDVFLFADTRIGDDRSVREVFRMLLEDAWSKE